MAPATRSELRFSREFEEVKSELFSSDCFCAQPPLNTHCLAIVTLCNQM